ncbi:hypothetical protein M407DRAFT_80047 [Tulasnella calospora MUT 4182]|uniref:Maintenance of telomere capping protein 1 n=1 Tax=Tulasnella calospora MUT 4182 TaxID=1051891 RepID=A0A0C3LK06_9AGAM|nr:hypothetical protein M407DRAFT_80047 [Tulasnella calospora MUT 4182]
MSKSKEALALLDDLDSYTAVPAHPPPSSTAATHKSKAKNSSVGDAADALAFLDEITQKSTEPRKPVRVTLGGGSRPGTPSVRRSAEQPPKQASADPTPATTAASTSIASQAVGGGWGWGSVWNTASAALAQAKEKVDEQVKSLEQNEQAKKWGEGMMSYVKQAQLDKLAQDLKTTSLSTLTGIINVVAPPIAEHEVIQVTLSHDMVGYDGVETLVYRGLARVLEQVEGGDLVVNRGQESRLKDDVLGARDLNAVEGLKAALKLSEVDTMEQIKIHSTLPKKEASSVANPTTYSQIFLRIQPFTSTFPPTPDLASEDPDATTSKTVLQFLLYLSDPSHQLIHTAVSQTIPASWLALWDEDDKPGAQRKNGEWIEDMLIEALRVAVEVIGQEYIVARMSWDSPAAAVTEASDDEHEETTA